MLWIAQSFFLPVSKAIAALNILVMC